MTQPRPTMTDVARTAGVSLKTVSRVVNGGEAVRPETAAVVLDAIRALGFRRNEAARTLRSRQRSRLVGLVIKDLANPFYSAIARGVEEVMRTRNELVITGSSDEDPERERELTLLLCERRVDGLLIVPTGEAHRYLLPELEVGMHAVFIDRPPGDIEADLVLLDNVGGARIAVDHLVARGHRRIAMAGDDMAIFTARERWRGFCDALAAAGCPVDETLVRVGVHDAATAERVVHELLGLADPPTAIFAGNNRIAAGAVRAVASAGSLTELVSFDDLELADVLSVAVSAVSYDPAELGRRAAELLCLRLDGHTGPPQRTVLPTQLVERLPLEEAAA
jgi:LacI family transcriptional regulator, galactose operon repressor